MTDHNDYNTTIIHGGSVPKKRTTSNPDTYVRNMHQINTVNSASLERKIDSGDMSLHPFIDKNISRLIQTTRNLKKNGDKTITQRDLALLANQKGGKGIIPKDIADIESGNFRLTTENKLKIQAVKRALNIT